MIFSDFKIKPYLPYILTTEKKVKLTNHKFLIQYVKLHRVKIKPKPSIHTT